MAKYKTFQEAINLAKDARSYQMKHWPSTQLENAGGRPFEEWILLMDHYQTKLKAVYAETPHFIGDDGNTVNVEGQKRIEKYAAIVANLALWAVQSAMDSIR